MCNEFSQILNVYFYYAGEQECHLCGPRRMAAKHIVCNFVTNIRRSRISDGTLLRLRIRTCLYTQTAYTTHTRTCVAVRAARNALDVPASDRDGAKRASSAITIHQQKPANPTTRARVLSTFCASTSTLTSWAPCRHIDHSSSVRSAVRSSFFPQHHLQVRASSLSLCLCSSVSTPVCVCV